MSFLGNLLWILLGGFIIALEYLVGGVLICLTIIGIPFGLQCFKLALLALFPFGREIVSKPTSSGCLGTLFNIIWLFIGGIWIALTHLIFALLLAVTIIGLPFAKQHAKLATLALTPFGKEIR
ncbi:MAG: YccF domain-containing protein [candidate division KSB1 bacterium]|nr:YccF domain-containing protein [candidate division KSB1 bacterium]MDZ7345373.1 YccF domain-containing protein [candidate division KSB1 bacterium]